jgi:Mrp family chromosome partitioning ATPase
MFVDMPPGTSDVPLTVYQSLPIDGIIVVTSPQELVSMIVEKAVNMAALMKIPVLGIVENMAYATCPDCGKRIDIFGESRTTEIAVANGVDLIAQIPMNPNLASMTDKGMIELFSGEWLDEIAQSLERL